MKLKNRAVIIAVLVLAPWVLAAGVHATEKHDGGHDVHWGYEGKAGPLVWGDLKSEFATCKTGKTQSPIDLESGKATEAGGDTLDISYNPSILKVLNNGHTIQVNYEPGSSMIIDGKKYDLLQFHFHTPSEYTVDGKAYPLEEHFVHKNAEGQLAVMGVFYKEGKKNDLIQSIWDNLPSEVNKEKVTDSVKINAKDTLPGDQSHFHFAGSLTTPPCSEGVNWMVMASPMEASVDQINKFKSIVKMNARPIQPHNDRKIEKH